MNPKVVVDKILDSDGDLSRYTRGTVSPFTFEASHKGYRIFYRCREVVRYDVEPEYLDMFERVKYGRDMKEHAMELCRQAVETLRHNKFDPDKHNFWHWLT